MAASSRGSSYGDLVIDNEPVAVQAHPADDPDGAFLPSVTPDGTLIAYNGPSATVMPRERLASSYASELFERLQEIERAEMNPNSPIPKALPDGTLLPPDSSTGAAVIPRDRLAAVLTGGPAADRVAIQALDPENSAQWKYLDHPVQPGWTFLQSPSPLLAPVRYLAARTHGGFTLIVIDSRVEKVIETKGSSHRLHVYRSKAGDLQFAIVCGPAGKTVFSTLREARDVAGKHAAFLATLFATDIPSFSR